jgi:Mlc titration factor MtfA (ptsG expression regulator)
MGSGGFLGNPSTPTRIVVNRTYETNFTNIFLHEHAHTLDRMHGEYSITRSRQWREALARDTRAQQFLQGLCADNYCANAAHPEESFAELFAYFYGCAETRAHLTEVMPNVARLLERMTNVRALLDGRINLSAGPPAARP